MAARTLVGRAVLQVVDLSLETERAFRATLGQFATGVAVATASDHAGRPIGVTVNSFVSVSLSRPLVTWRLSRAARSLADFSAATLHAINVLGTHQVELARRFAAPVPDRFAGVAFRQGRLGVPLLDQVLAQIVIARRDAREIGDHVMFTGEIVDHHRFAGPPLVFHAGAYATRCARHEKQLRFALVN
jgi:flavin reductase (DIM6/NTAB) family NADH-FMN oxidoreductase RutF